MSDPGPARTSPVAEIEAFFQQPRTVALKEQVCEMGRRLWQRGYVDGNGGNLAIKVAPDLVLCTPTLVSKGFMNPADICLVDLDGNQLAGSKKRTSEILLHLEIMKAQPRAVATVHCHAPHANAFGLIGEAPPVGLLSEYEMTISAAVAPYFTPGNPELGRSVAALAGQHNTILMANHGVVCWSHVDLEDAYFKVETLEAYCITLTAACQVGKPFRPLSPAHLKDLLDFKRSVGIPDPRLG